jgi:hypothetical protein
MSPPPGLPHSDSKQVPYFKAHRYQPRRLSFPGSRNRPEIHCFGILLVGALREAPLQKSRLLPANCRTLTRFLQPGNESRAPRGLIICGEERHGLSFGSGMAGGSVDARSSSGYQNLVLMYASKPTTASICRSGFIPKLFEEEGLFQSGTPLSTHA